MKPEEEQLTTDKNNSATQHFPSANGVDGESNASDAFDRQLQQFYDLPIGAG